MISANAPGSKLKPINPVSSRGAGPLHLALDPTGKFILVAYGASGQVAVIPAAPGGRLSEALRNRSVRPL